MKKVFRSLLFVFAIGTASVAAQNTAIPQEQQQLEVTDAELTEFAEIFQQMRMMNQEVQKEMMAVVKNEKMTLERFNEIHQASLDPQEEVKTTQEEEEKYNAVISEIEEIQPKYQEKMQNIITASNLSIERYQQLAMALRSNTGLQQRLQEILKS